MARQLNGQAVDGPADEGQAVIGQPVQDEKIFEEILESPSGLSLILADPIELLRVSF